MLIDAAIALQILISKTKLQHKKIAKPLNLSLNYFVSPRQAKNIETFSFSSGIQYL